MKKRILPIFILIGISCSPEKSNYVTKTYIVMGTVLNVTLPQDYAFFSDSVYYIFRLVDSLMNPVKPYSDIYKVNSNSGKFVSVHPYTADCIKKALLVSDLTDGAFDITVGSLVHLWHFDEQGKYKFPPEDSIEKYRKFINFEEVIVSDNAVKIGKNQRITVAGIAKGYAIDLSAQYLKTRGVNSAIIDAGGDLYLLGSKGRRPWKVGIRDPHNRGINRIIALSDLACCTSGDYERYVEQNGTRYSHIFSPFTGYPVSNGVRSVTVIYGDATLCDAFATAIFVLGPDEAKSLRKKIEGLEYYIVTDDTTLFSDGFNSYFVD
ncbi:MAG: FAD:protein FMN transferase [bacterium]|nr:FAD:protein FMN transferase [bacterium]